MSDGLELRGLRVVASVGVLAEEHARPQPLEIDITIELDLGPAGRSDALAETVDYSAMVELASRLATERHHELLESIADGICQAAIDLDPRVEAVDVAVRKLRPPIGLDISTVGVRVRRSR